MSTITEAEQQKITHWLHEHPILSVGVGNEESACSVAAINLALYNRLTDDIPECMSEVVGAWIIVVQDEMPADIRNSDEWRLLLPRHLPLGRRALVIVIDEEAAVRRGSPVGLTRQRAGRPWPP